MMIAVPVSWQPGSTIPAAMLAFFSSSRATNRSFSEACATHTHTHVCTTARRPQKRGEENCIRLIETRGLRAMMQGFQEATYE